MALNWLFPSLPAAGGDGGDVGGAAEVLGGGDVRAGAGGPLPAPRAAGEEAVKTDEETALRGWNRCATRSLTDGDAD